jgi:phytoene dehydrogenase-like protein
MLFVHYNGLKIVGKGPRMNCDYSVAVIGGGIAGLVASAYLTKAGVKSCLLEAGLKLGGRASTTVQDGYYLNQGPHALYRRGHAVPILTELGIDLIGGLVGTSGWSYCNGQLTRLPYDLRGLLTSNALSWREKWNFGRSVQTVLALDTNPLAHQTFSDVLDQLNMSEGVCRILRALLRLSTYIDAPDQISAKAAIDQLNLAFGGVMYLDRGWQVLVDGLAAIGAELKTQARVDHVHVQDGHVRIELASGQVITADKVVIATPARIAAQILGPLAAARSLGSRQGPAQAACLDLVLDHLPVANRTFVLSLDRPLYYSVHSQFAQLAPKGEAVVHVAKYLSPLSPDRTSFDTGTGLRAELEAFMDRIQPGWRELVRHARFIPKMTVAEIWPDAAGGGLVGRPSVFDPAFPQILLAGDWAGDQGLLLDAACASGRTAAHRIIEQAS